MKMYSTLYKYLTIVYMIGALNCYAVLRKQAEANKLEENLRDDKLIIIFWIV